MRWYVPSGSLVNGVRVPCRELEDGRTLTAPCVLDVPYGPEPEQQIDIYLPDRPRPAGVPVFIFFHGGGRFGHEVAPRGIPGLISSEKSMRPGGIVRCGGIPPASLG